MGPSGAAEKRPLPSRRVQMEFLSGKVGLHPIEVSMCVAYAVIGEDECNVTTRIADRGGRAICGGRWRG